MLVIPATGGRDRRITTSSKLALIYVASFRLVKSQTKTVSKRNQANIQGCHMALEAKT